MSGVKIISNNENIYSIDTSGVHEICNAEKHLYDMNNLSFFKTNLMQFQREFRKKMQCHSFLETEEESDFYQVGGVLIQMKNVATKHAHLKKLLNTVVTEVLIL